MSALLPLGFFKAMHAGALLHVMLFYLGRMYIALVVRASPGVTAGFMAQEGQKNVKLQRWW